MAIQTKITHGVPPPVFVFKMTNYRVSKKLIKGVSYIYSSINLENVEFLSDMSALCDEMKVVYRKSDMPCNDRNIAGICLNINYYTFDRVII